MKDFIKLKTKKLEETTEFDYIPDYRLTVDKRYRKQLEYKIGYVYRFD
jgi:hypothetical protein